MLGIDVAALTTLCKLLFDGLAVLVIFILYVKNNKKRQEEYDEEREEYKTRNEELHDNYNAMIKDIVQGVTKKHLTPEEGRSIARIDKKINDTINIILKDTDASRVCIVKYHNGNKDMTGKSFLKMSMTNEVINIGVAPMMGEFKDVFRSLLAYWCHELEINDNLIIRDTENIKDIDITMYQYLKTRNIESKYGLSLKDSYNNVIGFICIEYLNKNDFNMEKIEKTINANLPKIQALISINGGVDNEL